MVNIETFRRLALEFPGTEERPHFDRAAFKVTGRRIFATLHEKSKSANMVLSKKEQAAFHKFDKQNIYPIPNKWGEHGWTTFELRKLTEEVVKEALQSAYNEVAQKRSKK